MSNVTFTFNVKGQDYYNIVNWLDRTVTWFVCEKPRTSIFDSDFLKSIFFPAKKGVTSKLYEGKSENKGLNIFCRVTKKCLIKSNGSRKKKKKIMNDVSLTSLIFIQQVSIFRAHRI